jgi:glycosyltransferase involved in cell wall biosynthesis
MMFDDNTPTLISIVMPTYNRGYLIGETIESIRKQTYPHWELIIVDDGSDDNTAESIKAIPDQRIRYFEKTHLGMEKARNFGLSKAKGELIGFMDSDDLWATAKLEKQLEVFNKFPDVAFCLTGGYEFKEYGKPLVFYYKQNTGHRLGNLFVSFFKSGLVAATPTLVFKKHCLENIQLPEQVELAHIHFILRLALRFNGCVLYDALLYRRMHANNYSSLHQTKRHYDGIELIKNYKNDLPKRIFVEALLKSHINFGEIYLKSRKKWKAIGEFFRAWKYQPFSLIPAKKIAKALLYFL